MVSAHSEPSRRDIILKNQTLFGQSTAISKRQDPELRPGLTEAEGSGVMHTGAFWAMNAPDPGGLGRESWFLE